ncbi:MAG TPA: flavodoxin family protein [Anaerovoracaceae bacterium]|nr:flavodoxin family protein [Anaerovoracaceae bacterium]
MKILLINGSPRNDGNCKNAIEIIENKLGKYENNFEINTINLVEKKLLGCIQCDDCKRNGGNCNQNDDSSEIINNIYDSDFVIFVSPVYWWNITGQMKIIIDKFYSKEDEFNHIKKRIGYLTIGAEGQEDDQYHFIKKQLQYFADGFDWDIEFNISLTADAKGDLIKNEDSIEDINNVIDRSVKNFLF